MSKKQIGSLFLGAKTYFLMSSVLIWGFSSCCVIMGPKLGLELMGCV